MENDLNRNETQRHNQLRISHNQIAKKLKSRIILFCSIIGIGLGLLISCSIVLPTIYPFKQYILTYVDQKASMLLLCNVGIGKVYVQIPNGIVAKNVVLSDSHSRLSTLFAQRVSAKVEIFPLLKGHVELHSITIKGLRGEILNSRHGLFAGPVDIGRLTVPPKNQNKPASSLQPIVHMIYAERCTVSFTDSITKIATYEAITSAQMKFLRSDSMMFMMHAGGGYFTSPVWSGSVNKNDIQGSVGPASIHFVKGKVIGDSAVLSINGTIPFTIDKSWDLTATTEAFVSGFKKSYQKVSFIKPVGRVTVKATMMGTIIKPVITANIVGYGIQTSSVSADSLALYMHYSNNAFITKANIWSKSGDAKITSKATIAHLFTAPVVGAYTVSGIAEKIDMRSLMPLARGKRQVPLVVTNAEVYGAGYGIRKLTDTICVQIKKQADAFMPRPLSMVMICAKNKWNVDAEILPDIDMKGSGTFSDSGAINGSIHVWAKSLSILNTHLGKDNVGGSMAADINIQGTIKKPVLSSRISMGPSFYNGYHIDTLFTQNEFADKKLQWKSLVIARNNSMIKSTGAVTFGKKSTLVNTNCNFSSNNHDAGTFSAYAIINNDSLNITAKGQAIDPLAFSPWFPKAKQLQGGLNFQFSLAGIYKNPDVRCSFLFDHPVSKGMALLASGDIIYTKGIATAKTSVSQKEDGKQLLITAHVPLAIQGISSGASAIGNGAKVTIAGDSVAYGSLLNAFAPSIESKGTISIHGLLIKAEGIWAVSCSTHLANNKLFVKREKIKVGDGVFDLYVNGPLARPAARFSIAGTSIEYRGNGIDTYNGHGEITDNIMILDTLRLSGGGGEMDMVAAIPVTMEKGFSFNKNAGVTAMFNAMPLGIIQPFLQDAVTINKGTVSGQITMNARANGFPQLQGSLAFKNGELLVSDCDKSVGPLFADIVLKNDSILLQNMKSKWGNGTIAGNGFAVIGDKDISYVNAKINIKDVHVRNCYENLDLGIAAADIAITKDSFILISANVKLADTRFIQDFSLLDLSKQIKRNTPPPIRKPSAMLRNIGMKIIVDLNNNLTFDSNLGKMLVDGTVTVAGRPDKPVVNAQLQITNGFVYYLDRKFTVSHGNISQYDPQKINPLLDISATATVTWFPPQGGKEDYEITILVKDNLSNPLITLSANPTLTQPQIISLLTLGTIQTGFGSDLGSRTGSLVGQQLAGFGTRKLARFLNVESVDIYGNVFGPSSEGPQLSVSKQLSSRINVTYKKGLSKLSQQMIQVSYRIFSFLYLEAESDQQAQGGVDLKFRYSK